MNEMNNEHNNVLLKPVPPLDLENFHQIEGESQNKQSRCAYIFFWILQILTWLLLAAFITLLILNPTGGPVYIAPLVFFVIVYIMYIVSEQLSSTAIYLRNKSSNESIYLKMSQYFSTRPRILFHCECYHYETVTTGVSRDSQGQTSYDEAEVKEVTYKEDMEFIYYSVRDVSGLLYLNCDDEATIRNKSYIKLELIEEINFADTISYMDYRNAKNNFYDRNRDKDEFFDFKETKIIPGIMHHNLIKLRESEPCTVNYFLFVIFTILTLVEFYKPYVNSFCIEQKFKIRKIISTRYDLNNPEYEKKYQNLNPKINLLEQKYDFQPKEYNYLNNECSNNAPTEKELKEAEKFKDNIPEYRLSNKGIILDNDIQDNKNETFNEDLNNNNENQNQDDLPVIEMGEQGSQPPQS